MTPEAEVVQLRSAVEQMQTGLEQLQEDKLLSDREVTRLRRESALLKRMLDEQRKNDPRYINAKAVLEHWVEALGKKANTVIGPTSKRAQLVIARMNDHSVEELIEAVDGLAARRYVGPHGRISEGTKDQLHDDIEIVMRDETYVARFRKYAQLAETKAPEVVPEPVPKPPARRNPTPWPDLPPIDKVLGNFPADNFPRPRNGDTWEARCPAHGGTDRNLVIRRGDAGRVLLKCWSHQCSIEDITAALDLTLQDLFEHADRDIDANNYTGRRPTSPDARQALQLIATHLRHDEKAAA